MNKLFKVGLIGAAIALAGCQDDAAKNQTPNAAEAAAPQITLTTEEQKVAYAIGVSMAQYIGGSLDQQQELGVNLDRKLVLAGVTDGLDNNSQLTDEQMQEVLMAFEQKVTELANAKREAEMAKVKEEGAAWLAEMAKQEGVVTTDSGLMYKVITEGDGAKPTAADTVTVHYRGTLPTGEEFDSSYARDETISFPLNGVIKGWTEGLQLMPVGSKYELYIPSELAYGERGAGQMIAPNTPLKFEVELFAINGEPALEESADK
ncbi:FKBP-type peptidyl-prolyl cis-trans isomerase [Ferrimonas balearica]|uniref:FKBP-type peptidyl-prolyl cis-trans isomerase n=1 Tax=Ferrimonas balearica TaxID=44012 RepID=UPI001C97361E|nr:FKBP-type peptidyl-prolyl cis-trans isomerase [Ferrimonas balearica]MBY6107064.1 FKBP-type peptidyl-prolyl cis-trans isomerase [Ferrimonas balearica]